MFKSSLASSSANDESLVISLFKLTTLTSLNVLGLSKIRDNRLPYTTFPLISASGVYSISKLWGATLIGGRCLKEGAHILN